MRAHRHHRRWRGLLVAVTGLLVLGATSAVPPAASAAPDSGPIVKVNQVAYTPGLPKQATVVSTAGAPLAWTLRAASGAVVASGQTTVRDADALSGDSTHVVDFSSFDTAGNGYTLSVAGATSVPFDISAEPLRRLRYDALAFFYHQRSGAPILAQHVGAQHARPAGHVNVAPNRGDDNVPCRVSCGYTQDVRGGWYDAGDHGKYGVNGGISAWQLINTYERTLHVSGADRAALADGTLAIPERGNGVPDILDEARWEVEFLLRMQVPTGRTDAGMVRHKVSDENWTGLPMRPDQDPQPRLLSAVTTAATLNLAAVGAQAARVWRTIGPAVADRALAAARTAYAAARANPNRLADPNDGNGGGTYVDDNVSDEFYWAAAELFTTTGSANYRADLTGSPLFRGAGFDRGGFDWWWTAGLGDTTLATVPNGLPAADVSAIRAAFAGYADRLLSQSSTSAYPALTTAYYWGSNGVVANAATVLALAHDFTGQQRYRAGAHQALDYLFGRNPFNHSYVTGYGERVTRNVHHRFWANQVDPSLPTAPPGALAGGPNADLQDPVAQARLAGCRPQKCYLDDIEAWSVNEVALNWNSALAWLAFWAAEKAGAPDPGTPGACSATATVQSQWSTGYVVQPVTVTNTGGAAVTGWTVAFTLPTGHAVTGSWNATLTSNGQNVTARGTGTLAPGGTATWGFQVSRPSGSTGLASGYTCAM